MVNLASARFRVVHLGGVVMRGVELSNVDINGVYTGPLVGAERDLAVLEARGS